MLGWKDAEALASQSDGTSIFYRLKDDGEKVVGVFCGEPYVRILHWTGDSMEPCTGKGQCEWCSQGIRASKKFSINFYIMAEERMVILEGGIIWFRGILKVKDKYGLDDWIFEIERQGAAGDPKTKYTILPDRKLEKAEKEVVLGAEQHDLKGVSGRKKDIQIGAAPSRPNAPNYDPYIEQRTAQSLGMRLQSMAEPKVATKAFLTHFRIKKISELRESKFDEAMDWFAKCQKSEDIDDIPF